MNMKTPFSFILKGRNRIRGSFNTDPTNERIGTHARTHTTQRTGSHDTASFGTKTLVTPCQEVQASPRTQKLTHAHTHTHTHIHTWFTHELLAPTGPGPAGAPNGRHSPLRMGEGAGLQEEARTFVAGSSVASNRWNELCAVPRTKVCCCRPAHVILCLHGELSATRCHLLEVAIRRVASAR